MFGTFRLAAALALFVWSLGCTATGGGALTSGTGSASATTGAGSSSGGATAGGSGGSSGSALVGELGFTPQAEQLFTRHDADGGAVATRLRVKIFGAALPCDQGPTVLPAAELPWVDLDLSTDDQTDVAAGTYDVTLPPANHVVGLTYNVHLADGGDLPGLQPTRGTITYTLASVRETDGSFNATFDLPDGGSASLAGTFAAAYCH